MITSIIYDNYLNNVYNVSVTNMENLKHVLRHIQTYAFLRLVNIKGVLLAFYLNKWLEHCFYVFMIKDSRNTNV